MKASTFLPLLLLSSPAHGAGHTADELLAVDYVDPYDNNFALQGFVSLPGETPAPAVVIIPDWDGTNDYEKERAHMISDEFGWVGFAADIYGAGFESDDMNVWRENAIKYRSNNTLFYGRIQAAVDVLKEHPDVMADKIAVIGYCFGGTGILTYSFLGATDVVGAVSFHGGLTDFPVTGSINHPILVLSGGDDDTGTAVEKLENTLDMANSTWQITRYSGVEHAFTKWSDPRYNSLADHRSWREMATFLEVLFGELTYESEPPASTDVVPVPYDDDGFALTGYLAVPEDAKKGTTPAVIIIPAWSGTRGVDGYESQRATLLAEEGYVAFVADIYGDELGIDIEEIPVRIQQATYYRNNYTLFVSRMQAAVDLVAAHELVNAAEIGMIGYCFGGTGVVDYAFTDLNNVKVVVPFHGGLTSKSPILTDLVYPYMLIQSGGIDDAHGNNTELEMELNAVDAKWEITRYSDVCHGFTEWGGNCYNAMADWRSWDSMLEVLDMMLSSEKDGNSKTDKPQSTPEPTDAATDDNSTSGSLGVRLSIASVLMFATVVFM